MNITSLFKGAVVGISMALCAGDALAAEKSQRHHHKRGGGNTSITVSPLIYNYNSNTATARSTGGQGGTGYYSPYNYSPCCSFVN